MAVKRKGGATRLAGLSHDLLAASIRLRAGKMSLAAAADLMADAGSHMSRLEACLQNVTSMIDHAKHNATVAAAEIRERKKRRG